MHSSELSQYLSISERLNFLEPYSMVHTDLSLNKQAFSYDIVNVWAYCMYEF